MEDRGPPLSLPVPATSFVGRDADRRELADAIGRERLVTIHGPPGVGKTRLAMSYALEHADAYPGGVALCDLSDASADDLGEALVRALGLAVPGRLDGDALIAAIGAELAARGACLLVLDELERLVPSGVGSIATLRASAPAARILTTSRTRLGLPGELVFSLAPLGLPARGDDPRQCDAVRLFVERARAVRRGFDVLTDPDGVADLVRALDGLPLAIELAAARMHVLSPSQLLDDDERRRDVLSRPAAASGERGVALWAEIGASWGLLSPSEKSTLAQLSVFRGGFTVEAAERVASLPSGPDVPSVAVVLEALVDRSLVAPQTSPEPGDSARFSLLTSIREYASERLGASDDLHSAQARHAAYYLGFASSLRSRVDGHGGLAARRRLSAEMENLVAVSRRAIEASERTEAAARDALQAALAIDAALSARGPHLRRAEILGAALERAAARGVAPEMVAEGSLSRAHARRLLGDVHGALDDCRAAAELASTAGDRRLLGRVLGAIGLMSWEQGDLAGARDHVERALALHAETGDHASHGATSNNSGLLSLAEGRLTEARKSFEDALRTHRAVGNRRREAMNLNNLAFVDVERELSAAARASLDEAAGIARELGDVRTQATITLTLGLIDLDAQRLRAAEARCTEALEAARACGDRFIEGQALGQLGMVVHAAGRPAEARGAYGLAVARLRETGSRGLEGLTWACLACLDATEGRLADARAALAFVPKSLGDQGYERAAALCRECVDLLDAGADDRPKHADAVETIVREARDRRPAASDRRWSVYARWAVVRLQAALALSLDLGSSSARRPSADAGRELAIERRGRWFSLTGGERVTLHRRRPLARLLEALLEARIRAPGRALTAPALLARGWPDERCDVRSGANRVYNALATLRKMGLRDVLLSRDDGYLLDPERAVRVEE